MRGKRIDSKPTSSAKQTTSAPAPLPPYACEVCGVRFAKVSKRDAHLLDVHRAHFGLSPRAQSPNALDGVDQTVRRAVSAANLVFSSEAPAEREPVVCTLCPPSRRATFKNARGLAQHILSKHSADDLISGSAVSQMTPPAKRGPGVAAAPIAKGTKGTPKGKRTVQKKKRKEPPAPASSGMKPPLSPKGVSGAGSPRSASPPKKVAGPQSCARASGVAERRSVPMDFSAIIGFTTNAHKSYYRLSKR